MSNKVPATGKEISQSDEAAVAVKSGIAKRLGEVLGPRSTEALAKKMGVTPKRLRQMLSGDIPSAWVYLARLSEDGVDICYLVLGNGDEG